MWTWNVVYFQIGGLNFMLMLDCEEYYMQRRLLDRGKATQRIDDNLNAIQNRISFFKNNTLPVFKHYDDQGKLVVVSKDFFLHVPLIHPFEVDAPLNKRDNSYLDLILHWNHSNHPNQKVLHNCQKNHTLTINSWQDIVRNSTAVDIINQLWLKYPVPFHWQ